MFDFFTFTIYLFLLFSIYFVNTNKSKDVLSYNDFTNRNMSLNIKEIISLILIGVIVAIRYEVGNDWYYYKEFFIDSEFINSDDFYFESGFFYLNQIFATNGFSYQTAFFFITVFTWFFVFKSVHRNYLSLFLFFIFCTEFFFWSMNGVRQFIAIAIYGFSIKYIVDRKIFYFILCIYFASLFHQTALFLLPTYILRNEIFAKRSFVMSFFVLSFAIGTNDSFMNVIEESLSGLVLLFQLERGIDYLIQSGGLSTDETISLGIGYYLFIFTNLIVIYFSDDIIKKNKELSIYFSLFFVGAVIYNLTYWSSELVRINQYFIYFKSFCLTLITYHSLYSKQSLFKAQLLILLFFINFLALIYISSNMSNPYRILLQ